MGLEINCSLLTGQECSVCPEFAIWASPVYFAARYLGYQVRFYDASFQEWGSNESLPVTAPDTIPE